MRLTPNFQFPTPKKIRRLGSWRLGVSSKGFDRAKHPNIAAGWEPVGGRASVAGVAAWDDVEGLWHTRSRGGDRGCRGRVVCYVPVRFLRVLRRWFRVDQEVHDSYRVTRWEVRHVGRSEVTRERAIRMHAARTFRVVRGVGVGACLEEITADRLRRRAAIAVEPRRWIGPLRRRIRSGRIGTMNCDPWRPPDSQGDLSRRCARAEARRRDHRAEHPSTHTMLYTRRRAPGTAGAY